MKMNRIRRIIQTLSLLLINSNYAVFQKFGIYQGKLKSFFSPALNCYACPLSRFACPIGTLQHFIALRQFPYYVSGFILGLGGILGRLPCGFFCPFGFIQELFYKIGTFKIRIGKNYGYLKYIILVIIIPWVYLSGEPMFCKFCPAGTLEGGIPVMLSPMRHDLISLIGWHFYFKLGILIFFIMLFMTVKRPFCRFVCPLGAIWGLTNKASLLSMKVQKEKCTRCDECREVCPMDIRIYEDPNHFDCIRCFKCIEVCPENIITAEFMGVPVIKKEKIPVSVKVGGIR